MQLPLESMDMYLSLFGMNDRNVTTLEQELDVSISLRGQDLIIKGDEENKKLALCATEKLMQLVRRGEVIDSNRIRYIVALLKEGKADMVDEILEDVVAVTHRGRRICAKTIGQREYVDKARKNMLTIAVGPAGTGKTYLAMAMAVVALKNKEVERIVNTLKQGFIAPIFIMCIKGRIW